MSTRKSYHGYCPRCRAKGRPEVWYTWRGNKAACPECLLEGYGVVNLKREADPQFRLDKALRAEAERNAVAVKGGR